MRKLVALIAAALVAAALVVIFGGTAEAAHVFTGPNETATEGATVTFNVDWPHGSITLTCEQGTTQVLNRTQKINTGFLLDSGRGSQARPRTATPSVRHARPRTTEGHRG